MHFIINDAVIFNYKLLILPFILRALITADPHQITDHRIYLFQEFVYEMGLLPKHFHLTYQIYFQITII